eukprot:TRINITY_DN15549_c0_g1_i4.p1 TRINITY_DN15549_c0_g1~~TRINITY_DN15549_c0_g1_i4.p1  ORF type:complete len:313 (-),score=85.59 TRINITY_DN15549_c0_g1_i4:296-1111(-)
MLRSLVGSEMCIRDRVGLGKTLRIYDLGKKKLLRKCENRAFPNFIVTLNSIGDRIIVGDIQESFMFVKYRKVENQLLVFADDTYPRWVTAACMLDYDTMVGADKFGNIFIARLPDKVNDDLVDDPTGMKARPDSGLLNGAPHKLEEIMQFHVGEAICSLTKQALVPGGLEAIVYTTIMGSIGCLVPFGTREDIDFFQHLEMHMRQSLPPLAGRDHLAYRSYYYPCKDVVDGELCEQFLLLKPEVQNSIAEELDRSPNEVLKKLEELRNRVL